MPSRAVLRKKARRESKRRKQEAEGTKVGIATNATTTVQRQERPHKPQPKPPAVEPRMGQRMKRARQGADEKEEDTTTDGVSRKERKRFEAKRRLERQLKALNRAEADCSAEVGEADGEAGSCPDAEAQRHDPKYKNGTFWRDRKERRKRTVFLGNVPVRFKEHDVESLVRNELRRSWVPSEDEGAAEADVIEGEVVESVDFLNTMTNARRRHMYVTMRSVELAECVAKALNGKQVEGIALRCNFAADKTERKEAIQRRPGNGGPLLSHQRR
uniref:WGS project CAEQ00000000 data, annotated contig 31 n=1 Tax=Trypanosoma congolense (strain IL3000) TaxID=1068625 RepID=F9WEU2_TRYCI|nr:unnamed protein product [Trypanosoma congolense IL3000]